MTLLIKSFTCDKPETREVLSSIHHNGWDISPYGLVSFWEYGHSQNLANEALRKLPISNLIALNKETFRSIRGDIYRSCAGYIKNNIFIIPIVIKDRYELFGEKDIYFDRITNDVIDNRGNVIEQHKLKDPNYWEILNNIRRVANVSLDFIP